MKHDSTYIQNPSAQPALQPADEAGQSSPSPSGLAPAMQARNHAATGGVAKPAPASVPPGAAQ